LTGAVILARRRPRDAEFLYEYNPEQAYLLPPSVKDALGENYLCFFVHRAVEKLDLGEFEAAKGQRTYRPAMELKVWLYAYALGMTSSRRLEQRIRGCFIWPAGRSRITGR
jgi:transposase